MPRAAIAVKAQLAARLPFLWAFALRAFSGLVWLSGQFLARTLNFRQQCFGLLEQRA